MQTRCGFVAVLGRPNAGKSSLLNALSGQNLALVSSKANATRKQQFIIITHSGEDSQGAYNAQIIFTDTPGIHHQEKLLNKFMLNEALRALSDCDLKLYLAPAGDSIKHYEEFLALLDSKKAQDSQFNSAHILLLTKCDMLSQKELLEKITQYESLSVRYLALIPLSIKKGFKPQILLDILACYLPQSPFLYDEDIATISQTREIVKELIRESLFENLSDEVPYESDVLVESYKEGGVERIYAKILTLKNSQKALIIGENGKTIKRIGICARQKIESFLQKKVFLRLEVVVDKAWSKEVGKLKKVGYDMSLYAK
ncbi:GTPase Era [Helicobacter himalayensis]|uniref:GTPase Era n=1 Tax=Helicobacter himalayensis TaxID=1591088 RepID=UPI003D6F0CD0